MSDSTDEPIRVVPSTTTAPPPGSIPDVLPDTIGRYRIVREIGRGGMGIVYEGYDDKLQRRKAVKLVAPKYAADASARERFLREARAMARLEDADICVRIDDTGELLLPDGQTLPYLVMPLLEGVTLADRIGAGPVPLAEAVAVVAEVAEALAIAHRRGLIHRDIKPSNVWLELTADGRFRKVRLLDFGLTRAIEPNPAEPELTYLGQSKDRILSPLGTPAYMSPEQARSQTVSEMTDVFSLGIVFYELLAGSRPFEGATQNAVMLAIIADRPRPLVEINAAVPPWLSQLVGKLLAKEPNLRPKAAEAAQQLRRNALGPSTVEGGSEAHGRRSKESPPVPMRFGKHVVAREIGRGGMGVVYESFDAGLNRKLAIKAMTPELAADESARKRFSREAQTLASVQHPNIVPIYEIGEQDGLPYFVMPLLVGNTLDAVLADGKRMPLRQVMQVGRYIADALAAAHRQNLIHRDVKPSNVWLETKPDGKYHWVKLLDFGLTRPESSDALAVSYPNAVIGTPMYMSPEQSRGDPVDFRTDLFSLGTLLYEMAVGRHPFPQKEVIALLAAITREPHMDATLANPRVLPRFSRLLDALLAKRPAERPASAKAVVDELGLILNAGDAPGGSRILGPLGGDPQQEPDLQPVDESEPDFQIRPRPPTWGGGRQTTPAEGTNTRPRSSGRIPVPPPRRSAGTVPLPPPLPRAPTPVPALPPRRTDRLAVILFATAGLLVVALVALIAWKVSRSAPAEKGTDAGPALHADEAP